MSNEGLDVIKPLVGEQIGYHEHDEVFGMLSLFTDNIVTDSLASGDVASAQKERVDFITGVGSKR